MDMKTFKLRIWKGRLLLKLRQIESITFEDAEDNICAFLTEVFGMGKGRVNKYYVERREGYIKFMLRVGVEKVLVELREL